MSASPSQASAIESQAARRIAADGGNGPGLPRPQQADAVGARAV